MENKIIKEEEVEKLNNGWISYGSGKYKDEFGVFWMCGCCSKIYRNEKDYINHIYNQKCKENN